MERNTTNYYYNTGQVADKLNYKWDKFCSKLNGASKVDQIIAETVQSSEQRNLRGLKTDKVTPLHLLQSNRNNIWMKIAEKYLPDLNDKLNFRHPPSAFDICKTLYDSKAKERLDEWILKLLDGPELYHILGLIELPIEITVPSDIHHLERIMAFELFSESNGSYRTIPGFLSPNNPYNRSLENVWQALGTKKSHSRFSTTPIKPDQYRPMFKDDIQNSTFDPRILDNEVSLLFSPIDNTCCFSYTHSSLGSTTKSIIGIPSYNGTFGVWKNMSEELQITSNSSKINLDREEIELILICDAVRCLYKKLREQYIGPDKPGAFQLLKDWMSYDLPEEGREQALYLTNYAIVRSISYSQCFWPEYFNNLALPLEIYLPNRHHTNWDHLVGYFQQLVRTHTLEGIPTSQKSLVCDHFSTIFKQEREDILEKKLDTDEELRKLLQGGNLAQMLAAVEVIFHNSNRDLLFGRLLFGILLGNIPGVYIQNWTQLQNTFIQPLQDGTLNIKPNILTGSCGIEGLNASSKLVDGLMAILYDLTDPRIVPEFKSKFCTQVTKENSINVWHS